MSARPNVIDEVKLNAKVNEMLLSVCILLIKSYKIMLAYLFWIRITDHLDARAALFW